MAAPSPVACLVFFALWTLGLVVLGIGPIRVVKVLRRQAPPNAFPADQPHGSPFYRRLMRAHANCVENLPVFGALVLSGEVSGLHAPAFATLATAYVAARVGQTSAHLASGSNVAVNVRFAFFLVQVGVAFAMGAFLLQHLVGA